MKNSTLLQSFLLAAGLMAGGIPAAQADQTYTIVPSSYFYNLLQDNFSPGQTPWWSSSQHNPGSGHFCDQGKHSPGQHGNHGRGNGYGHEGHWQHGKYDGRGDRYDYGDRWKHGKHDGHSDGHDRKGKWQHGKHDGRGDGHAQKGRKLHGKRDARKDTGRKGHRSSSAGIGYTGRS